MDVLSRHLGITDEKARRRQGRETASHKVRGLLLDPRRFLRAGECLVVSVCVVDSLAVFIVFSQFCVAVIGVASMGSFFHLIHFHVSALLRREYRRDSSSGRQNGSGFPSFFAHCFWFPFLFILFLYSVSCSFHNYIAVFDSNPFRVLCQAFPFKYFEYKSFFDILLLRYYFLLLTFHVYRRVKSVSNDNKKIPRPLYYLVQRTGY